LTFYSIELDDLDLIEPIERWLTEEVYSLSVIDEITTFYIEFSDERKAAFEAAFPTLELAPYTETVDWDDQWEQECDLKEGTLKVEFESCPLFYLKAGPGFGNLTHPTTRLMIDQMKDFVKNQVVFDIGSGSGVLSIAALKLGAKRVVATDIDPDALSHTDENAALNDCSVETVLPSELPPIPKGSIILMNMIRSEQEAAFRNLRPQLEGKSLFITSGVLAEEKALYEKECSARGLKLLSTEQEDQWLSFVLSFGET